MNIKRISHRISFGQLRRLQSSSASNSKIQVPARIKRGPTDILQALESTIPKDLARINYIYHDDPFLTPLQKYDYRTYGLSYESGKKTANWIHQEHSDLFPKHLSEPEISAFQPPLTCTDKNAVSEELLVQVISQYKVSDALAIYKLLEANVSNQTKQALLELLCFYNTDKAQTEKLNFERWYSGVQPKYVLRYHSEIDELYEFLIKQDPLTAAAAYNVIICGLAKYLRVDEAWAKYQECKQKDLPLNVTTYNYVLGLLTDVFNKNNSKKVETLLDILKEMNEKKVKPNVRTLNAALKVVTASPEDDVRSIIKFLFSEFKRINVKFSLATYYYPMLTYSRKGMSMHRYFREILQVVKGQSFTIQDPADSLFFSQSMYLANRFSDRDAGDLIHDLLCTGNNRVFISTSTAENSYYLSYMSLLLTTSMVEEFFEHYKKIVPSLHVPQKTLFKKIADDLRYNKPEVVAKCLPRFWSDLNNMFQNDIPLKLAYIDLMEIDSLPPDSPLRTTFVDAAWSCWNSIKDEIKEKPEAYNPVETAPIAHIAIMLLRGKRIEEAIEVVTDIMNQPDLFIPTMTKQQVNDLFNSFISEDCVTGAFLTLEYAGSLGFENIVEMGTKLYNHPQLTSAGRNKLLDLVGVEKLSALDSRKSS